jgi:hypothetical protein
LAKLCVSVEATAGIAIVGLFLASLWRDFTVRVEASQAAQLLRTPREQATERSGLCWGGTLKWKTGWKVI